jgi:flagellar hook-basal body complex protein FliE
MPTVSSLPAIQNIPTPGSLTSATVSSSGVDAFSSILQQSVANVSQLQSDADASVNKFLTGEQDDPHNTMLAVQRSSLAFDMFVQIRNKVVQAYQEVMKMPE